VTCVGDDDHIGADGPSRGIPAHRPCAMGQRQRHLLVQRDGRGVEVPCSGGSTEGSNTGGVAEQAVNTTACGTPDASGAFVATTLVCFPLLHTRLRTHRASGVPRALSTGGRDVHLKTRAQLRREIAKLRPNRCRCLTFEYERDRNRSLRSLCTTHPITSVVPAKAGTHTPCHQCCAGRASNSDDAKHAARTVAAHTITIHARGYGSLPAQGRRR